MTALGAFDRDGAAHISTQGTANALLNQAWHGLALGETVAPEDVERTCSTHLWEFDCPTGARLNPATCRLLSYPYPVRVETGRIQVGF